ncbi:HAMP domain-containing sensor histidine kinase [Saccharopolyspora sp. NFXS83]|uniref:sensor histidine kinase n=1 Tax=Saccharopolyspora sp. NFXS83 TaxID=2993560 RepID=UPI00224AD8F3|nr:HAMP domain-containing sensor histidine kinase [Saccharopolyspora sp. NFXS83]MCX2729700.1 HAMP domain-containing sensor histidine kinase [Saccharopolyspora sp. NFXS83]
MRDRLLRRRLSIRGRTTITATTIVALAVVAIGALLVGYLNGRLNQELDAALQEQLSAASASVVAGSGIPEEPSGTVWVRAIPSGDPAGSRPALPDVDPAPVSPPTTGQLADTIEPLSPADPPAPVPPGEQPGPRPIPAGAETMAPLRTATATVATPTGNQTLIASASTRSVQRATEAAATGLLFGMPVLLAVVATLTWFSTGRALRPVEAIRHEFTRLSAQDLRGRMPVPASGDEIARLALTLNDTLDRLDDSVRRQRRFVADASHELRSPLAALRTPLEVAQAHPNHAHWPSIAEGTLQDLDRLERLTSDLLALARIDGTTPVPGDELDLSSLTADTVARRAPAEPERVVEIEPGIVVRGHRTHLARLITNLLDNAEAHAEHQVALRLRTEDGCARLDVVDDGPGIPAEFRDQVFERFARLDTARAREQGGSGLGLALVREIVDMHRGSVVINDSGRGAHFTARFPLSAPSGSGKRPDGDTAPAHES